MFLRRSVGEHMKKPEVAKKISDYLGIENVYKYILTSKIELSLVWATDVEILASASLLNCDVNVYSSYGSSMEWQLYLASFNLSETSSEAIMLQNLNHHFEPVMLL